MLFRFVSDPAHGWLEVPLQLIHVLGVGDQISQYSYRKGLLAYLEEDCDAGVFIRACRAQGIPVEYDDVYEEHTAIRSYQRFTALRVDRTEELY